MEFLKNDTAPANGISDKKKLAAYSAAAVAFVAMAPEAKADIVYVDVDPDEVVVIPNFTDITHVLDLNSDGVDDFAFYGYQAVYSPGYRYALLSVEGYVDNYVMASYATITTSISYTSFYDVLALNNGALIGGAGPWQTSAYLGASYAYSGISLGLGQWRGQTDKYMGVKFVIAGQFHYGWIRMDVAADLSSFTIKGWAYEDQPETPITAGTITSIDQPDISKTVNIYGFQNVVTIQFDEGADFSGEITIHDLKGSEIFKGEAGSHTEKIVLDNITDGAYIVRIRRENAIVEKKVFLTK